jgi:D-glycero-D-manno-heptose 1,7-bisphosphate phosphatase
MYENSVYYEKFFGKRRKNQKSMKKRALFLDRDGIINRMVKQPGGHFDSPQKANQVVLVDGIENIISLARQHDMNVIVISNQPGIAKGKMNKEVFEKIEQKIFSLLKEKDVEVDRVYQCFHHPLSIIEDLKIECECRKPGPGLLLQAATDFPIDMAHSIFIGDNVSDMLAGTKAGCHVILYLHDEDTEHKLEAKRLYDGMHSADTMDGVLEICKKLLS